MFRLTAIALTVFSVSASATPSQTQTQTPAQSQSNGHGLLDAAERLSRSMHFAPGEAETKICTSLRLNYGGKMHSIGIASAPGETQSMELLPSEEGSLVVSVTPKLAATGEGGSVEIVLVRATKQGPDLRLSMKTADAPWKSIAKAGDSKFAGVGATFETASMPIEVRKSPRERLK